jgi:hypothetical protein
MDAMEQLYSLLDSYQKILKLCYDALDAGASQQERDALRKSIEAFVSESND